MENNYRNERQTCTYIVAQDNVYFQLTRFMDSKLYKVTVPNIQLDKVVPYMDMTDEKFKLIADRVHDSMPTIDRYEETN